MRAPTFTEAATWPCYREKQEGKEQMLNWQPDLAFVVAVVRGPRDISRTTWGDVAEAKRYVKTLRRQGIPAANICLYHKRLVWPTRRASQSASEPHS